MDQILAAIQALQKRMDDFELARNQMDGRQRDRQIEGMGARVFYRGGQGGRGGQEVQRGQWTRPDEWRVQGPRGQGPREQGVQGPRGQGPRQQRGQEPRETLHRDGTGGRPTADHPRSLNPDFDALTERLFQVVQLQNHIRNWKDLPRSLGAKLDGVFKNISLPMPDQALTTTMTGLNNEAKTGLALAAQDHLEKRLREVLPLVRSYNQGDYHRAENVARGLVRQRLGNRVTTEQMDAWLAMARTNQDPTPPAVPRTDPAQAMGEGDQPLNGWVSVKRGVKRGQEATPPPPTTTNRYFGLEVEGGDETSAGEEEGGEQLDFPRLQRSVKKRQDRRPTPVKSVPASSIDHPSAEAEGACSMDTEEETEEGGESEREATRDEGGEKKAGSSEAATRAGAETRDEGKGGRRLTDWLSVSQPNPSGTGLVRRQVQLSQQAPIILSITPSTNPGRTNSDEEGTTPRLRGHQRDHLPKRSKGQLGDHRGRIRYEDSDRVRLAV